MNKKQSLGIWMDSNLKYQSIWNQRIRNDVLDSSALINRLNQINKGEIKMTLETNQNTLSSMMEEFIMGLGLEGFEYSTHNQSLSINLSYEMRGRNLNPQKMSDTLKEIVQNVEKSPYIQVNVKDPLIEEIDKWETRAKDFEKENRKLQQFKNHFVLEQALRHNNKQYN